MPDEPERAWLLLDPKKPIAHWVREFRPPLAVVVTVREWLRSREVNPFAGARYVDGFDNYLFAAIPETLDGAGRVVTCAYWVYREDATVRVDMISDASWPV